uniref:Uncharacterized protein n=1 Tax=Anguilla anguilla TaxID=7936 RepID=A0A0E9RZQ7_ANGAN
MQSLFTGLTEIVQHMHLLIERCSMTDLILYCNIKSN